RSGASASQEGNWSLVRTTRGVAPAVSSISEKAISIPLQSGCRVAECRRPPGLQRGTVHSSPGRSARPAARCVPARLSPHLTFLRLRQALYGRFHDLPREQELFLLVAPTVAGTEADRCPVRRDRHPALRGDKQGDDYEVFAFGNC